MDETAIWKPVDIRKLLNEVSELRVERDEMKGNYLRACQTVAAMHAAATGKPGDGPRRGVVEDIEDLRAEKERLQAALEKFEDKIEGTLANELMIGGKTQMPESESRISVEIGENFDVSVDLIVTAPNGHRFDLAIGINEDGEIYIMEVNGARLVSDGTNSVVLRP